MNAGPLTPKEYAEKEFGCKRSAKWVRKQCARYVATKGKRGIPVIARNPPYLIPSTALGLFNRPLLFLQRVQKVA